MSVRITALTLHAAILAAWVGIAPRCAIAGSYAFSGLNVSNFVMFTEDSVIDPTDPTQGPNRNGAGHRLRDSDFDYGTSGRSDGAAINVALDNSRLEGGGVVIQACLGDCGKQENDFTRPAIAPSDPSSGMHFSRNDEQRISDLLPDSNDSPYANSLVAEIDLNRSPSRSSLSRRRRRTSLFLVPEFSDAWVIDFDADVALRTRSDDAIGNTALMSTSSFSIRLEAGGPGGELLFEFRPNGTGLGGFGANIIADPFTLNAEKSSAIPPPESDQQHIDIGQFRAITPPLMSGMLYVLTVEQEVVVNATLVPEPSTAVIWSLGWIAVILTAFRTRRTLHRCL